MLNLSHARPPVNPRVVRILIVEDNAQLGESLVALFQRFGFDSAAVGNGNAALKHLLQQPAEIMISDIFMPDGDGLELLRMLRRIEVRPRVVVMTGADHAAMPDMFQLATLLGAERTIRKPFEPEAMLQLVRGMLGDPAPDQAGFQSPTCDEPPGFGPGARRSFC